MSEHDELIERLRAADPARALGRSAAGGEADADADAANVAEEVLFREGRARVIAARRGRARRRTRAGALGGGLALFLGVLALGLSGGGGGQLGRGGPAARLPGVEQVLAGVAQAGGRTDGRIVELNSTYRLVSMSGGSPTHRLWTRREEWIRLDRRGRTRQYRVRTLAASTGLTPGLDVATYRDPAHGPWWSEQWRPPRDGERWRLDRQQARLVPDLMLLRAAEILHRARGGKGPHVELLGRTTVGGRDVWRLRIDSIDDPPRSRGYKELYVDAVTYAPVRQTSRERGVRDGLPWETRTEETIHARRVLDDTPANRRLLDVRGPTR